MDLVPASEVQLVRCGKAIAPVELPPQHVLQLPALGRFDDPARRVRVLYAAETRYGALLEWLASFRVSMKKIADLERLPPPPIDEPFPTSGVVTQQDLQERRLGTFTLQRKPHLKFLDARESETISHLRVVMASTFVALGVDEFDPSELIGRNRKLTQAIADWAYNQGYSGIVYMSRYEPRLLTNWALFEPLYITLTGETEIAPDDPDLIAALKFHRLRLLP
jgi:hypothetical protein